jgi:hypothetical protein
MPSKRCDRIPPTIRAEKFALRILDFPASRRYVIEAITQNDTISFCV